MKQGFTIIGYMPEESMYSQRDPIGIAGGNPTLYGYVWNSSREVDVFGLSCVDDAFGNGRSFRELMSPDELKIYDDYWRGVGADKALVARDEVIAAMENLSNNQKSKVITVVGGVDLTDGTVTVGIKRVNTPNKEMLCA